MKELSPTHHVARKGFLFEDICTIYEAEQRIGLANAVLRQAFQRALIPIPEIVGRFMGEDVYSFREIVEWRATFRFKNRMMKRNSELDSIAEDVREVSIIPEKYLLGE